MRKTDIDQRSRDWHLLRWGKVTGTTLSSAIGTPAVQQTLLYDLVAARMVEPQITDLTSAAVTRGVELEPLALKAATTATGIPFIQTGMLLSDSMAGFGMSPDAIYEENETVIGGIEIKCPGSKKHVEYLIKDELPKEYRAQVLAPFLLSDDVEWWYFASYDDRNYEIPLFLKRITRGDFPDIDEDRQKLIAFLCRVDDQHTRLTF